LLFTETGLDTKCNLHYDHTLKPIAPATHFKLYLELRLPVIAIHRGRTSQEAQTCTQITPRDSYSQRQDFTRSPNLYPNHTEIYLHRPLILSATGTKVAPGLHEGEVLIEQLVPLSLQELDPVQERAIVYGIKALVACVHTRPLCSYTTPVFRTRPLHFVHDPCVSHTTPAFRTRPEHFVHDPCVSYTTPVFRTRPLCFVRPLHFVHDPCFLYMTPAFRTRPLRFVNDPCVSYPCVLYTTPAFRTQPLRFVIDPCVLYNNTLLNSSSG